MRSSYPSKLSDKIRWGYLTAFVLLLTSYILTFYSTQQVLNQQERVTHTSNVINSLDDLLSAIKEVESGFRGYVITNDNAFLTGYYKAPNILDSIVTELKWQTSDNSIQQKRLDTLQDLIKDKVSLLARGLAEFRNTSAIRDSLIILALTGKQVMDNIKIAIAKLQKEENNLMVKRSKRVTTLSNFIKVINVASIVIAIVLAFYSITSYSAQSLARQAADKQSIILREQLELNINQLKELNTELIELRSIEKFAATGRISRTIAHEVRNPLTNINLAAEHLKSEMPPSEETGMLFEMITRNSNRINDLISDLLNSTKATPLDFIKVNINDLVDSSLSFAQDRISLKEIKVIKNYTNNPCQVMVDFEKINIAFLNIIVNAVEAMEEKTGVLTLKTDVKKNKCIVSVSDNGKGISTESLSKLFEPFFTTKEKGNGLGLTNTQNIILSHNASVQAESVVGEGTSFIVSFNHA